MLYFKKSQPAPACLAKEATKKRGDYKCGDVLERLQKDFKNKCYICEKTPTTINIEHFKSHQGDKSLKFSWDNLFFACSHCNNTKLAKYDDILDCTQDVYIEEKLKYIFHPYPYEKVTIKALDSQTTTRNTKKLLESVFNGTTKQKKMESANIRNKLLLEIQEFQKCLTEYCLNNYDEDYQNYLLAQIKSHLHQASNFTSFKRWIIRDNAELFSQFSCYLKS